MEREQRLTQISKDYFISLSVNILNQLKTLSTQEKSVFVTKKIIRIKV